MSQYKPHHFLQANGLDYAEEEVEFFDPNLAYDSPLFLDPFLLRKSSNSYERELFKRLSDFFLYVYHQSQYVSLNVRSERDLKRLVTFNEPSEAYIGYATANNKGNGPGGSFADKLLRYYLDQTVSKYVDRPSAFPDGLFNPYNIELFTDRVGPDNISDLTIQLIKDYLIEYTLEQCTKFGIKPKKDLRLDNEGYDYINNEWKGGAYVELPENPRDPGTPVLLIPKRLLRASDDSLGSEQSRLVRVLKNDPELSTRFAKLLLKNIDEISMSTVRETLQEGENIHLKYFEATEKDRSLHYNFDEDKQQISADKRYEDFFENKQLPVKDIESCDQVIDLTFYAIKCYKEEFDNGDGWREAWHQTSKRTDNPTPVPEPALGRKFRGIANGVFKLFEDITFDAEVGANGRGFVDFKVVYKSCRIAIELKLLNNVSKVKGDPNPGYMRGIKKQLPFYIKSGRCKYGIYLTGQHYTKDRPTWSKANHDTRRMEVEECIAEVEEELKKSLKDFKRLHYINIDMSPQASASKL